jgi:hypothetical protein
LIVKFMGMEVAAAVPPEPYIPPAAWAGLVTVTATIARVAMAAAGILAISWFPVTKVVLCPEPFQLTIASELKLLPLTVKVNPGLPAVMLFGTSCIITGTVPAEGAVLLGDLYPPHPKDSSVSNSTEIIFMTFSSPGLYFGG